MCFVLRLSQLIGMIIRLFSTVIFPGYDQVRVDFEGSNVSVSKLSKHYLHVKRLIFNAWARIARLRGQARDFPEKGLFHQHARLPRASERFINRDLHPGRTRPFRAHR